MSVGPAHVGDTIIRTYTFTDENGALYDPTSISIQIIDPTGTVTGTVTQAVLTHVSTGVWQLFYTLSSNALPGVWTVAVSASLGTTIQSNDPYTFTVVASAPVAYASVPDVVNYAQVQMADYGITDAQTFNDFVQNVIAQASAVIDDHCRVPQGFFQAGGLSFTEIIDVRYSLHPGYYLAVPTYYPYPYILTSQLSNYPVLSLQHVYVNQAGYGVADAWSDTPGEDDSGAQFPTGFSGWTPKCSVELLFGRIKFVNAVPARYYQGVKAAYTAGYASTPQSVNFVCLQLAASILQVLLQRKISPIIKVGDWTVKLVIPDVFTLEHKKMLAQYQRSLFTVE